MQQISFGEFLETVLPGLRAAAEKTEWTERDWQQAMRQTSMGLADNIVKAALSSEGDGWPRLASVNSPEDGVSTFIVMESRNATFTITVSTARKAEPMDPEPPLGQDERCVFCGKVHENATTPNDAAQALADNTRDRATADEPVKPWPAWGSNASN